MAQDIGSSALLLVCYKAPFFLLFAVCCYVWTEFLCSSLVVIREDNRCTSSKMAIEKKKKKKKKRVFLVIGYNAVEEY